nr:hypothetical protein Iba_chr09dCG16360 [Ipomoea batatas]
MQCLYSSCSASFPLNSLQIPCSHCFKQTSSTGEASSNAGAREGGSQWNTGVGIHKNQSQTSERGIHNQKGPAETQQHVKQSQTTQAAVNMQQHTEQRIMSPAVKQQQGARRGLFKGESSGLGRGVSSAGEDQNVQKDERWERSRKGKKIRVDWDPGEVEKKGRADTEEGEIESDEEFVASVEKRLRKRN